MKKKIALPCIFLLATSSLIGLTACSNKWSNLGDDKSQIMLDIPGLKFKNLDDFSGSIHQPTINQFFNNFIKTNEIKKEIFSEFTKRLQLSVIKSKKNHPLFKETYEKMMTNLDNYIKDTLHKQWGNNKDKEEKKAIEEWGSLDGFHDHLLLQESTPNNVYETFRNKFINSFQTDYERYSIDDINRFGRELINAIGSSNFNFSTWAGADSAAWTRALMKAYEFNTQEELKNQITSVITTKKIESKNLIKTDANNMPKLSITQQANKLSDSQKFIAERWYFNLKPLLVSQINFKYDGKDKNGLEDGIEKIDFDDNKNLKNITDFLNEISNNPTRTFEELANKYSDDNKKTFGQLPNLLTLDSSDSDFSPLFKAATYELAFNNETESSLPTTFENLLKEVNDNRKNDNVSIQFKKFKIGNDIITLIADTNEIRFIKINGYSELKNGYADNADIGDKIDADNTRPEITSQENITLAKTPYLQFLFDQFKKRVENDSQSENSGFNPFSALKTYTDFSQSNIDSNTNWWFWFWDIMSWIEKDDNNKLNFEWYKKYIESSDERWSDIISKKFKVFSSALLGDKVNSLSTSLNNENDNIKKILFNKPEAIKINAQINVSDLIAKFMNNQNNLWTIESNESPAINLPVIINKTYPAKWWITKEGE